MRQFRWAVVGAALLTGYPADRLTAQIGHDPATSPYRDIYRAAGPVVFAGHLGGDRGEAGVGPGNALTFGLRYELPMGRSTLLQFTASYLKGDRYIVNPAVNPGAPGRRA